MNIAERAAAYAAEYMAQYQRPPPGPFVVLREEWEHFVDHQVAFVDQPEIVRAAKARPSDLRIQGMRILVV